MAFQAKLIEQRFDHNRLDLGGLPPLPPVGPEAPDWWPERPDRYTHKIRFAAVVCACMTAGSLGSSLAILWATLTPKLVYPTGAFYCSFNSAENTRPVPFCIPTIRMDR